MSPAVSRPITALCLIIGLVLAVIGMNLAADKRDLPTWGQVAVAAVSLVGAPLIAVAVFVTVTT